jgi:hypothetical protein
MSILHKADQFRPAWKPAMQDGHIGFWMSVVASIYNCPPGSASASAYCTRLSIDIRCNAMGMVIVDDSFAASCHTKDCIG